MGCHGEEKADTFRGHENPLFLWGKVSKGGIAFCARPERTEVKGRKGRQGADKGRDDMTTALQFSPSLNEYSLGIFLTSGMEPNK